MTDLPNYQQIKAWLGPGWIATNIAADIDEVPATWNHNYWPTPWYLFGLSYICYLLHTDGTRVEVRAPTSLGPADAVDWERVFGWVRKRERKWTCIGFDECITWHDPPAAENPTDLQPGERIEVLEYVDDAGHDRTNPGLATVYHAGTAGVVCRFDGDDYPATLYYESYEPIRFRRVPPPQTSAGSAPQPAVTSPEKRWPNADPAWIPALEAKLADQLKSGGYDCVEQRSLMVRAMRLHSDAMMRASALDEKRADVGHRMAQALASGLEKTASGIGLLRLPKPLIAYKRGR